MNNYSKHVEEVKATNPQYPTQEEYLEGGDTFEFKSLSESIGVYLGII